MSKAMGHVNYEASENCKMFSVATKQCFLKKKKKAMQKILFSFLQKVERPQADEPTVSTTSISTQRSAKKQTPWQDGREVCSLALSCLAWVRISTRL